MCISRGSNSCAFLWAVTVLLALFCLLFLLVYGCGHSVVVYDTVSNVDYGSVVGMEVVADREPSCWVGKGLGETDGKEKGRVRRQGNLGAVILEVAEWAEERCYVDFSS